MAFAEQRTLTPESIQTRVARLIWAACEASLYRFSFHTASDFRAALLRCFGAKVGKRCTIRRTSRIYYPWRLDLGDLSTLGDGAIVYNLGRVTIGSRVTISQEAYLCAGTHDYRRSDMPLLRLPIVIGSDAWICARAFVMPDVSVGEGAILGACGVATHDLDPWTIYGGNPATRIKAREPITSPHKDAP